MGKISYGIYVYHVFIIVLVSPLLVPYGMSEDHNAVGRIAVLLALTLAVSSLSWHWLEQPFLAWKKALASPPRQKQAPVPPYGQIAFARQTVELTPPVTGAFSRN